MISKYNIPSGVGTSVNVPSILVGAVFKIFSPSPFDLPRTLWLLDRDSSGVSSSTKKRYITIKIIKVCTLLKKGEGMSGF